MLTNLYTNLALILANLTFDIRVDSLSIRVEIRDN